MAGMYLEDFHWTLSISFLRLRLLVTVWVLPTCTKAYRSWHRANTHACTHPNARRTVEDDAVCPGAFHIIAKQMP